MYPFYLAYQNIYRDNILDYKAQCYANIDRKYHYIF